MFSSGANVLHTPTPVCQCLCTEVKGLQFYRKNLPAVNVLQRCQCTGTLLHQFGGVCALRAGHAPDERHNPGIDPTVSQSRLMSSISKSINNRSVELSCPTYSVITLAMTQRYLTSRLMSSISKSINNRSVELSVPHIQRHNPGNNPTVSHVASHVKY
ncbi:hypothetical protein J6590_062681 [Homalodisca vitripennis]|nr:hypothetical protein J6590_062681 [Homalodisca vitripennis]